MEDKKYLGVILIRGLIKVRKPVKDTLKLLRLNHKNSCIVIEENPVNSGMIKKVKDYITWGEIDRETHQQLIEKRGEEYKGLAEDSKGKIKYDNRFFVYKNKKYKKYFRLNPPRKGFERKGVKLPFRAGGALGYRGKKINELIKRML